MTTPSRSLTHTQLSRIGTSQKESRGAHINSYLISVGDDPRHAVLHFDSGSSIDFDCDPHTILNWIAPGRTVDSHTGSQAIFIAVQSSGTIVPPVLVEMGTAPHRRARAASASASIPRRTAAEVSTI